MPESQDTTATLSALDGRYAQRTAGTRAVMSEAALHSARVQVEAHWLLHLADQAALGVLPKTTLSLTPQVRARLEALASSGLGPAGAQRIAEIEQTTRHDVKAVEYFLREELTRAGATPAVLAMIHFACTSEDINNLAWALLMRRARADVLLPEMDRVIEALTGLAGEHAGQAMLALTHGQPASPTTLGKEMAVFAFRLTRARAQLNRQEILGKCNGATGNFNAHRAAFPAVNWQDLSRSFVEGRLGLVMNPLTTQIESHDWIIEYVDAVRRANTIAIGLARDVWGYISRGVFRQRARAGEVGSSTMPHKINPIDFENAEGNFGLANALAGHFADKLPIARFQRDLSDSTVLRSLGSFVGYSSLGWSGLAAGFTRIGVDAAVCARELDSAWEVLGEAVQTLLRAHGIEDAYERLKAATCGTAMTREAMQSFIAGLGELPPAVRSSLAQLTPQTYTGSAAELAHTWTKQGHHK